MKVRKNMVARVFIFMTSLLVLPGLLQAAEASVTRAVQGDEASQTAAFYQVEEIAQSVIQVLESDASHEQKHEKITRIADEHFAFDTIAKLSLARSWRDFSPAEQEEFVVLFREFLAKRYGGQFDNYDGDTVTLLGERTEPRGDQTVQTQLLRPTGV
jgi:phospholipid transport system substrate-binding protein